MQEFFTNTIESKFIKNLLSKTYLPNFRAVEDDDYILANNFYVYDHKIIKCTESGILPDVNFEVIDTYIFDTKIPKITNIYQSISNYYDSLTHKRLGDYLRAYKAAYDINLMPFYNCFNYTVFDNFYFSGEQIILDQNSQYKLLGIPIQYNKTYTIAIDSASPISYRAVIFSDLGFIQNSEQLDSIHTLAYSQFNQPFTYSLSLVNNPNAEILDSYYKDLYLVIQVPAQNISGLVVLEGDYTSNKALETIISSEQLTAKILSDTLNHNLDLLAFNKNQSYAFSDTLIEYLLTNAIASNDTNNFNIGRVQKYAGEEATGTWNLALQLNLYNNFVAYAESNKATQPIYNINGFVDKSLENYLLSNYKRSQVKNYSKIYPNKS